MATYLGNPSLSTAVKDRVMSTFEQALQLYKVGRTEEVVQGCGLILQMDPQFDPAKKLLEKARNPMAPIDIDKLVPAVGNFVPGEGPTLFSAAGPPFAVLICYEAIFGD